MAGLTLAITPGRFWRRVMGLQRGFMPTLSHFGIDLGTRYIAAVTATANDSD
mgnify:CR=1 FL=1